LLVRGEGVGPQFLTVGVQHGEVTAGVVHRPLVGVAHDDTVEVHLVLFVGGPQLLTLGAEDEGQLLLADHEQDRRTLEVGVEASKARFPLPEGLTGGRIVQKMAVLAVGADQERAAHRTDAYTLAVVEHVVHVGTLAMQVAQDLTLQSGGWFTFELGRKRVGVTLGRLFGRLGVTGASDHEQHRDAEGEGHARAAHERVLLTNDDVSQQILNLGPRSEHTGHDSSRARDGIFRVQGTTSTTVVPLTSRSAIPPVSSARRTSKSVNSSSGRATSMRTRSS